MNVGCVLKRLSGSWHNCSLALREPGPGLYQEEGPGSGFRDACADHVSNGGLGPRVLKNSHNLARNETRFSKDTRAHTTPVVKTHLKPQALTAAAPENGWHTALKNGRAKRGGMTRAAQGASGQPQGEPGGVVLSERGQMQKASSPWDPLAGHSGGDRPRPENRSAFVKGCGVEG